jgi:hypothetical protein
MQTSLKEKLRLSLFQREISSIKQSQRTPPIDKGK